MSACAALLGLQLRGVVDRIEGPMAVVEWRAGLLSDLPAALLPAGAGEGDAVVVQLRLADPPAALCAADPQVRLPAGTFFPPWPLGEATSTPAR